MAACKPLPKRSNRTPFSSLFRREELCYCTEELGSESISCRSSTMEIEDSAKDSAMQSQGHHGSLQIACRYHGRKAPSRADAKGTILPADARKSGKPLHFLNEMVPAYCQAASKGMRTFPPPISSLSNGRPIMRSFKSNGRFVLQRVDTAKSPFHAVRQNGRLRLILASSSASGLDCNGERQGALSHNAYVEAFCSQYMGVQATSSMLSFRYGHLKANNLHAYVPRSVKVLGSAGAPCVCLPTTLKLLLERAEKLSLQKLQASHTGRSRYISASVCKNVQGFECEIAEDNAQQLHEVKKNVRPAPAGSSALPLLDIKAAQLGSPVMSIRSKAAASTGNGHGSHDMSSAVALKRVEHGDAILSLSLNGLILIVMVEGTDTSMMTIKGIDVPGLAGSTTSMTSSSLYRAQQLTMRHNYIHQNADHHQLLTCPVQPASSYHTWHTSKPIDFRIAA